MGDIRWLREAELKHGRVCMLAASGFLLQSSVADVPDALQAVYAVPPVWAVALLGFGGYVESTTYGGKITMLDMFDGPAKDRAPGDFNFGSGFIKGQWPGYGFREGAVRHEAQGAEQRASGHARLLWHGAPQPGREGPALPSDPGWLGWPTGLLAGAELHGLHWWCRARELDPL